MVYSKRFPVIEYKDANEPVKAIYDETMREMNIPFVLNWFKCQGSNPILLRGNWEKLKSSMLRGDVPLILKQLIIYNISRERGSDYCTYTHGYMADSLSNSLTSEADFKVTENMDSDYIPSSYKTAVRIVTKASLAPKDTTDTDFELLSDEGFSDSELQELMSLADLTTMLNTIADVSGIKIDNELMEVK